MMIDMVPGIVPEHRVIHFYLVCGFIIFHRSKFAVVQDDVPVCFPIVGCLFNQDHVVIVVLKNWRSEIKGEDTVIALSCISSKAISTCTVVLIQIISRAVAQCRQSVPSIGGINREYLRCI